jgi:hypothetical protein
VVLLLHRQEACWCCHIGTLVLVPELGLQAGVFPLQVVTVPVRSVAVSSSPVQMVEPSRLPQQLHPLVLEPAVIFHWHPAIPREVRPVRWLLRLAHLLEATAGL